MSDRLRREPPAFRRIAVRRIEPLTPRMQRVVFGGDELEGFNVDEPAASVRLLLPSPGQARLVMPTWNGNEFLLPSGDRPVIRTFTPVRVDPDAHELVIDVVRHGGGAAASWAEAASEGDEAAVSGPGRGYAVDAAGPAYFIGGDETALPAITQLLDVLPAGIDVAVHVEISHPDARMELARPVEWHVLPDGGAPGDALFDAVRSAAIDEETRVWVAGEAAAVQRVRKHLFEERGVPRAHATVRGYWKHGRAAGGAGGDD